MALNFPDSPVAGTVFGAWRYDGTKWGAVSGVSGGGSAGDITAVFAGTGLTGGGTEGDVSIALAVPVTVARGGTGATDAATALTNLGGAPLASPVFTGDPKAPTPTPDDNDTSIATTAFVKAAVNFAGNTFYLDLTDSADVATYKRLLLTPSKNAETSANAVCTGTTSDFLIASFISDPGVPGAVEYPAGSAYRRLYGSVSGGTARFRVQVYRRTAAGVETLARDEYSDVFGDTTPVLQQWLATPQAATVMDVTERIVVKVSGRRVSGPTNVTVTLWCEGSAHASNVQTTIPLAASATISATAPLNLTGGNLTLTTPLAVAYGGTNAATAAAALTNLGAFPIVGVTTVSNAPAGQVGEFLQSASQGPVAAGSGAIANITTLSLSAGDWDVEGWVGANASAGNTLLWLNGGISTTSAAFSGGFAAPGYASVMCNNTSNFSQTQIALGRARLIFASTTTVYLVGQAAFSSGTNQLYGSLIARRMR